MSALLSVEGLRVSYGHGREATEVLRGLDLSVNAGEAVGLVGESGSGKSVASLALFGLLGAGGKVSGGRIVFEGEDLAQAGEKRLRKLRGKRMSMIFQDPGTALNPAFTIGTQLADVIRAHRPERAGALRREIDEILSRVGFQDPRRAARAYPHELSGGMKQRAMIAAAIVCEPGLLIADEPTTALDVTVQAQIVALLRSLVHERRLGLVFITHNLDLMAELCSSAVVLRHGEVVERGAVAQLFRQPAHAYTRQLIESIPRLAQRPQHTLDKQAGEGIHHAAG